MNTDRILNPTVVAAVAILHFGLMALVWHAREPKIVENNAPIEFVDLGGLGGDAADVGAPKPTSAQTPPAKPMPRPDPKPEPKPVEVKPVIKPVITQKKHADIQQPKELPKPVEKVKPEPKPELKPEPKAKPAEKTVEKPAAKPVPSTALSSAEGSYGGSAAKEGKGSGGGVKGESSGHGEGGGGKREGHGSGGGDAADGSGAGSSRSNPVKASGMIPTPPYPALSQENGEEGTVVLTVLVAPGGNVASVTVTKSSGSARLDRAARNAAQKGHFNANVWTQFRVPVRFSLSG